MRRTLKARLARLEKQSVSPKYEVLWVDVHSGETHEGVMSMALTTWPAPWRRSGVSGNCANWSMTISGAGSTDSTRSGAGTRR